MAAEKTDLRYPIGKFVWPESVSEEARLGMIQDISATPARLRAALAGLSESQLDTPYRPEGWTVRQVVHHLPDSHLNCYTRFKLALTEDNPAIKPYDEDRWARLADTRETPIETSLVLLDALHARWVIVLKSLTAAQWKRTFHHPEHGSVALDRNLALYAWHGRHHVGHVVSLRERSGW